jgi:hypothetical protein
VRGGHDAIADARHERRARDRPRIDDRLLGLALELAQHRVDRHRHTRQDGLDVGVDERGELLAVGALERTDLDRRHGGTSSGELRIGRWRPPPVRYEAHPTGIGSADGPVRAAARPAPGTPRA